MTRIIYTIGIYIYGVVIKVAALWSASAKAWIDVRKDNLDNLRSFRGQHDGPLVWVHCASQGEYEQALPLLQRIKDDFPSVLIALTFYSPSGVKSVSSDAPMDWIGFLPLDTPTQMKQFVATLKPEKVIIVKNEWWWNLLYHLKTHSIGYHFISSTIRSKHYFIRYKNPFFERVLSAVSSYGVIDASSEQILSTTYPDIHIYQSGDTRIDRVKKIALSEDDSYLSSLLTDKRCVIYGSVWESDISIIKAIIRRYPDYIHVLFPHKLDTHTIQLFSDQLNANILLSDVSKGGVYIVDKMGILSRAYRYAQFAYVGGGFGDGVHNVMEAMIYRIPVIIGPNHEKASEVRDFINAKAIYTVESVSDLQKMRKLDERSLQEQVVTELSSYFERHESKVGYATHKVFGKSWTYQNSSNQ